MQQRYIEFVFAVYTFVGTKWFEGSVKNNRFSVAANHFRYGHHGTQPEPEGWQQSKGESWILYRWRSNGCLEEWKTFWNEFFHGKQFFLDPSSRYWIIVYSSIVFKFSSTIYKTTILSSRHSFNHSLTFSHVSLKRCNLFCELNYTFPKSEARRFRVFIYLRSLFSNKTFAGKWTLFWLKFQLWKVELVPSEATE